MPRSAAADLNARLTAVGILTCRGSFPGGFAFLVLTSTMHAWLHAHLRFVKMLGEAFSLQPFGSGPDLTRIKFAVSEFYSCVKEQRGVRWPQSTVEGFPSLTGLLVVARGRLAAFCPNRQLVGARRRGAASAVRPRSVELSRIVVTQALIHGGGPAWC